MHWNGMSRDKNTMQHISQNYQQQNASQRQTLFLRCCQPAVPSWIWAVCFPEQLLLPEMESFLNHLESGSHIAEVCNLVSWCVRCVFFVFLVDFLGCWHQTLDIRQLDIWLFLTLTVMNYFRALCVVLRLCDFSINRHMWHKFNSDYFAVYLSCLIVWDTEPFMTDIPTMTQGLILRLGT